MAGRTFRAAVAAVIPEVEATRVCTHPAGHYDSAGNMICNVCGETIGTRRQGRFPEVRSTPLLRPRVRNPIPEVPALIEVRALPAVYGGTLKWLGGAVKENVKAKTLESLALVIGAIILGSFGFIFAAVGLIFFMAFLYLPSEADVMSRARKQAEDLPINQIGALRSVEREIISLEEEKQGATIEQIKQINSKLKSLREKRGKIIEKLEIFGYTESQINEILQSERS